MRLCDAGPFYIPNDVDIGNNAYDGYDDS